jgi:hypothetical protein
MGITPDTKVIVCAAETEVHTADMMVSRACAHQQVSERICFAYQGPRPVLGPWWRLQQQERQHCHR